MSGAWRHWGDSARPRRAVLLGNYQVDARLRMLEQVWGSAGVQVEQLGGARGQRFDIAEALIGVDIVVAKARAALDGMACGRAVYVCDLLVLMDGSRPDTYPAMEADNFAGLASSKVLTPALLRRDLESYEQGMGMTQQGSGGSAPRLGAARGRAARRDRAAAGGAGGPLGRASVGPGGRAAA